MVREAVESGSLRWLGIDLESLQKQPQSLRRRRIGRALRKARRQAGFSIGELARLLEVTRTTVLNWEVGSSSPSADRFLMAISWIETKLGGPK